MVKNKRYKVYGRISHLPGSLLGPAEKIGHFTPRVDDQVFIQEKLDGSNVAILREQDQILALIRAGFEAKSSRRAMHRLFAAWVQHHQALFLELLQPQERLVGEWLLLAHGTRYVLPHAPFLAFDLMKGADRIPLETFQQRLAGHVPIPHLYARKYQDPAQLFAQIGQGQHGALAGPEGLIYRLERSGRVLAVRKWVRPDYQTGCFFKDDDAVLPHQFRAEDKELLQELAKKLGIRDFAEVY